MHIDSEIAFQGCITDKENKKAVLVAAARRGAAGVVVSICQVEKDTAGRDGMKRSSL